jgi:hypothetical protein
MYQKKTVIIKATIAVKESDYLVGEKHRDMTYLLELVALLQAGMRPTLSAA